MESFRSKLRRTSLYTQMISAFLLIALAALAILAFFYIRFTQTALTEQGNQALYAAASQTANGIDNFLYDNLDAIRIEATLPSITTFAKLPEEQREEETTIVAAQTLEMLHNKDLFFIDSYGILDKNGRNILDSRSSNMGSNESDQAYFRQPLITGLPYASSIEFAQSVGGVYFYFSNPIRNDIGQIVGVLRVRYSISALQKIVSDSQQLVGNDSFALLLDEHQLFLSNDVDSSEIFRLVKPFSTTEFADLRASGLLPNQDYVNLTLDLPELHQGLENIETDPFFAAPITSAGATNKMAAVPLTAKPWTVIYAQPEGTFLVPITRAIQLTIIWTLFLMVTVTLLAVRMVRWLTTPIAHLTTVTEQITAGDLTAQATAKSSKEMALLSEAFNNMTAQLGETLEGLEQREDALEKSNHQLEKTLAELQSAQEQIIQQERVAAVGQLAAGIAHDFNNILMTIILSSDMMLSSSTLSDSERKRMQMIKSQGQRAADLTQQILDFSRRSMMQRKDMDLRPFLKEIQQLLQRTLPASINLVMEWSDKPYVVNADANRLQQVILNLAINARNAMPDGGELTIHLTHFQNSGLLEKRPFAEMEAGSWVNLSVTDRGVGISEETLKHIFEPFFTTRAPLGSGLGLSQVDGIVRQLGGYIDVITEIGVGTTFAIYLPEVEKTELISTIPMPTQLYSGKKETILLVEDDPPIRDSLMTTLESLNYTVLTAENGRDALQVYNQHHHQIDLILTDMVMPGMGGEEMMMILREHNPYLKFIVLSGYPLSNNLEEWQEEDLTIYCQKPISSGKLSQAISFMLHNGDM